MAAIALWFSQRPQENKTPVQVSVVNIDLFAFHPFVNYYHELFG